MPHIQTPPLLSLALKNKQQPASRRLQKGNRAPRLVAGSSAGAGEPNVPCPPPRAPPLSRIRTPHPPRLTYRSCRRRPRPASPACTPGTAPEGGQPRPRQAAPAAPPAPSPARQNSSSRRSRFLIFPPAANKMASLRPTSSRLRKRAGLR